jgi:hypothetical protein
MRFLRAFHLMEPLSVSFLSDSAISYSSRHIGGGTPCSIPVVTYLRIFCPRGSGIYQARPFSSCGVPLWVKLSMVLRCPSHPRTPVSPTCSGAPAPPDMLLLVELCERCVCGCKGDSCGDVEACSWLAETWGFHYPLCKRVMRPSSRDVGRAGLLWLMKASCRTTAISCSGCGQNRW